MLTLLNDINTEIGSSLSVFFTSPDDEITLEKGEAYWQGKIIHAALFTNTILTTSNYTIPSQILIAFFSGNLVLPENPVNVLLGDKRLPALLWERRSMDVFTDRQRAIIEHFIPASFILEQNYILYHGEIRCLTNLVSERKDEFVIKPGVGYQGENVFIGKYTSPSQWKDILRNTSLMKRMVLQQFIEPSTVLSNKGNKIDICSTAWGVYAIGEQYAGAFLRVKNNFEFTSNGTINCALGALGAQLAFIFEDYD